MAKKKTRRQESIQLKNEVEMWNLFQNNQRDGGVKPEAGGGEFGQMN